MLERVETSVCVTGLPRGRPRRDETGCTTDRLITQRDEVPLLLSSRYVPRAASFRARGRILGTFFFWHRSPASWKDFFVERRNEVHTKSILLLSLLYLSVYSQGIHTLNVTPGVQCLSKRSVCTTVLLLSLLEKTCSRWAHTRVALLRLLRLQCVCVGGGGGGNATRGLGCNH